MLVLSSQEPAAAGEDEHGPRFRSLHNAEVHAQEDAFSSSDSDALQNEDAWGAADQTGDMYNFCLCAGWHPSSKDLLRRLAMRPGT